MTITAAIVLYAVIWFLCLFVVLPIKVRTQGEEDSVVPGTPSSAPADAMMRSKLTWTTVAATLIWGVVFAVIVWGGLTVDDIDIWRN